VSKEKEEGKKNREIQNRFCPRDDASEGAFE
jgi:hypothetical protein